jgi:hypothetical protein
MHMSPVSTVSMIIVVETYAITTSNDDVIIATVL